jgi:hypothetical protein
VLGVGNVEMFFDNLYFAATPPFNPAVPTLQPWGIALLVLLLGGAGLLALRSA